MLSNKMGTEGENRNENEREVYGKVSQIASNKAFMDGVEEGLASCSEEPINVCIKQGVPSRFSNH